MTRRVGPYAPRRTAGSAAEVVDARGVRVAYCPSRRDYPTSVRRRASVTAHALTMDELSGPVTLRETDESGRRGVSVWDGDLLLMTVWRDPDSADPDAEARRVASAFADGYVVARRMCLGPRSEES